MVDEYIEHHLPPAKLFGHVGTADASPNVNMKLQWYEWCHLSYANLPKVNRSLPLITCLGGAH